MIRFYLVLLMLFSSFMVSAATLSGTVTGGGASLPDITVTLLDANQNEVDEVVTGGDGGYLFGPVQVGVSYYLKLTPATDSIYNSVTIGAITLTEGNLIYDIVLLSKSFKIKTRWKTLAGDTIANLQLILYDSNNTWLTRVYTDANGEYEFELPAGDYKLNSNFHSNYPTSFNGVPIAVGFGSLSGFPTFAVIEDKVIDITLPLVKFTLNVVDANGIAVEGASIMHRSKDNLSEQYNNASAGASAGHGSTQEFMLYTDEQGQFDIWVWQGIANTFTVYPPQGSDVGIDIFEGIIANDLINQETLMLNKAFDVVGRFKTMDGEPIEHLGLNLFDGKEHDQNAWDILTIYTDVDGVSQLPLTAGDYNLSLFIDSIDTKIGGQRSRASMSIAEFHSLVVEKDVTTEFILPIVKVHGRVMDEHGNAVKGVRGTMKGNGELTDNYSYTWGKSTSYWKTDEQGFYSGIVWKGLAYDVTLEPPNNSDLALTLIEGVVINELDGEFDFQIENAVEEPQRYDVSIQWKTLAGLPIEKLFLKMSNDDRESISLREPRSDEYGKSYFSLPADGYFLFVNANEYYGTIINNEKTKHGDMTIGGGYGFLDFSVSKDTTIDFTLPIVKLSLSITDPNGVGISDVGVRIDGWARLGGEYKNTLARVSDNGAALSTNSSGHYSDWVWQGLNYKVRLTPPLGSDFGITQLDNVTAENLENILSIAVNVEDTTPPAIQAGPFIRDLTDTTSTIEYFTNEPSYYVTNINGTQIRGDKLRTHHQVTIENLTRNTSYQATVYAEDAAGNQSLFDNLDFTTLAESDKQAPSFIDTPVIEQVSHHSASVIFKADEAVSATVTVYKGDSQIASVISTKNQIEHQLEVTDLSAISDYTLVVEIVDAAGNGPVKSVPLAFATAISDDTTAPTIISGPMIKNIKNGQATVVWQTSEPTLTAVSYNDGVTYGVHRSEDYSRLHTVTLDHLTADTLYQLTVSATDAYNNGPTLSEITEFYTLDTADSDPPTIIGDIGISQLGDSEALIQWLTDEPAAVVVQYGETADALTLQTSDAVPQTFHRVALTNLKPDQTYFYQAISTDTTGNVSTSSVQSFTTKSAGDNAPLTYVELPQVLQVTDTSLTFGVRTNRAATSQISCLSDNGDAHQVASENAAKQQQLILAGLAAGHNYVCSIESFTSVWHKIGGNIKSGTFGASVIRTKSTRDITPPIILQNPSATYLADKQVVVSWLTDERADTVVKYRPQGIGQFQYVGHLVYSFNHELVLMGLTPATTYEVIAQSRDITGNLAIAEQFTLTTSTIADSAKPSFVEQPKLLSLSKGVLQIALKTNEPSWVRAQYTDINLNVSHQQTGEKVGLHHLLAINLNETKNYTLDFVIGDLAGNQTQSQSIELAFASDADGDGLSNAFELIFGGGQQSLMPGDDNDNDGLTNLAEQLAGTDPNNLDSDGDGVKDGEDQFPIDPDESKDSDGDGIGDNADDINNRIDAKRYVFDRLWPQTPAPWYFQNIVAMDTDSWGNTYLIEYQDNRHVWLKQLGNSGRIIRTQNLAEATDDHWIKVGGLTVVDGTINLLVYHQGGAAQDQWRWHQMSDVGQYLGAIPLSGLTEQNIGYEDVKQMLVVDDLITLLVDADDGVTLLEFDTLGQQSRLQRLLAVTANQNLQLAFDFKTENTLVAGVDGECGQLWLYDQAFVLLQHIKVDTFTQNGCGMLQDVQFLPDGNIVIDGQKELYIISPQGGLVASQVTGLTGNKTRFIASDNSGVIHLATQGRVRHYDGTLNLMEDFAAFGRQSGYFVDPQLNVYSGQNNDIYTFERTTGRVQRFTQQGVLTNSFVLQAGQQRLINATDMVIDKTGKVYVLENAANDILLHQLDAQGHWLKQWVIDGGGFATALHYQIDKLTVLLRSDAIATQNTLNRIVMLQPETEDAQASQTTYLLEGVNYKALDLAGDGEQLFVLHVPTQNSERYSILTLDSQAQWLSTHTLASRMNPQSSAGAQAVLAYGREQWFVGYGNEVHLYRAIDGEFIQTFDQEGHLPGSSAVASIVDVAVTPQGKMVWADSDNGRVQVFRPALIDLNTKAVIVAGGGPYAGNSLWQTTLSHTNEAYRTLITQGISKDRIRYLADTRQDLDGNGEMDDIHDIASNASVAEAIQWAGDASELILYMVDHGGQQKFRMQGNEILTASELNTHLAGLEGKLTMIYDACNSGSFVDILSAAGRTIITSSTAEQNAYFLSGGAISFSGVFWQQILMGNDLQAAFDTTKKVLSYMHQPQTPLVSAEGSATDSSALAQRYIGVGRQYQHRAPEVKHAQAKIENNAIVISADVIKGQVDTAKVWAFVLSKDAAIRADAQPMIDLPTVGLTLIAPGKYRGTFDEVVSAGEHQLVIYASDRLGMSSLPAFVEIEAQDIGNKAILVAAYAADSTKQQKVEHQLEVVYKSLRQQGYGDDEIYVLGNHPLADDDNSVTALEYALTQWGMPGNGDIVISVLGDVKHGRVQLLDGKVAASQFNYWVKILDAQGKDSITLSIDGSQSSRFAAKQVGFQSPTIVIGATTERANWYEGSHFSFSEYFWRAVGSGETIYKAYLYAKRALRSGALDDLKQVPYLDDTGNGVGDERHKRRTGKNSDGWLAQQLYIGAGIITADDPPSIGTVMPDTILTGQNSATLYVEDIINTAALAKVEAWITHPSANNNVPVIVQIELTSDGNGRYSSQYDQFELFGDYEIAFVATDVNNDLSLPGYAKVTQQVGVDSYEPDNDPANATLLLIDGDNSQDHNIHSTDDEDWYMFYVNASSEDVIDLDIRVYDVGENLDVQLAVYKADGETLYGEVENFEWYGQPEWLNADFSESGIYYLRVFKADELDGNDTKYTVSITDPDGPLDGTVEGLVTDATTGLPIYKADVTTVRKGIVARTDQAGEYGALVIAGSGIEISFSAEGYIEKVETLTVLELGEYIVNIALEPIAHDTDFDDDGMTNDWETANGLDPNDASDASTDIDGDGLSNLQEFQNNTDPTLADSDGDGVDDGTEVELGLDPNITTDAWSDDDGDRLPLILEKQENTDETSKDNNVFSNHRLLAQQAYVDMRKELIGAAEVTTWVNQLNAGSKTPVDVYVAALDETNFALMGFVGRVYQAIVARPADVGGLRYYLSLLKTGTTRQEVVDVFVDSEEFRVLYGSLSDEEFVRLVYQNVMGREADDGGLRHWLEQLGGGSITRPAMMLNFIESSEYIANHDNRLRIDSLNLLLTGKNVSTFNSLRYQQWLASEGNVASVLKAILASDDYYNSLMATIRTVNKDTDNDGMPDGVEFVYGTDMNVKDNDINVSNDLFAKQMLRDMFGEVWSYTEIASQTAALAAADTRREWVKSLMIDQRFAKKRQAISRLYYAFFLRYPDHGGLMYWIGLHEIDRSLIWVADFFAASDEFTARYANLTNGEFVTLVYENLFDRTPDEGGFNYWQEQLDAAALTRGGLMAFFSESDENKTETRNRDQIVLLYHLLHRREVDDDEFTHWFESLKNGTDIGVLIDAIINSSAYQGRFY